MDQEKASVASVEGEGAVMQGDGCAGSGSPF